MKGILISIIVLGASASFAQKNTVSTGLLLAADNYMFDFKSNGFQHTYKIPPAYSFGLNVQYHFSDRFFSKGAILYSKRGYTLAYQFNPLSSGDPSIPRETSIDLDYIGVPVFLGYHVYQKNLLNISSSLGVVNELLLKNKETTVFENNSERESSFLNRNLNSFIVSAQMNLAFEYPLSDRIFVSLEPYVRVGFSTIDQETMKPNTLSNGGVLGIRYQLN